MPTSGSASIDFTLSLRVSWQARNIQRTGRIREDNMLALVIAHHIIDRTNDIISNYHALHVGIRIVHALHTAHTHGQVGVAQSNDRLLCKGKNHLLTATKQEYYA